MVRETQRTRMGTIKVNMKMHLHQQTNMNSLLQFYLRILTLLTDCKRMLEAFEAGEDFHSRTVMNMYPYIREAVDNKEVLLEWYPHLGDDKPPVPLLKASFFGDSNLL
ncbi:hypothetical protein RYX36_006291 [Vicia faba]